MMLLVAMYSKSYRINVVRYSRNFSFHGKYPSNMDLGSEFYDKLLDKASVSNRRTENMKNYPPQEAFLKMIPPMKNADGHQFKMVHIYYAYGSLVTNCCL
jgi:hypothetical protein